LRSFAAHNRDSLPLTLSLPSSDVAAFENRFGASPANVRLVADEDYCGFDLSRVPGWYGQQLCKLTSWRATGLDHHVVLDSDSYFIGDVAADDMIPPPGKKFILWGSQLRTALELRGSESLLAYIKGELVVDAAMLPPERRAPAPDFARLHQIKLLSEDQINLSERSGEIFNFFGAQKWYFFQPGQIFAKELLVDFENYMKSGGLDLKDVINIAPWEYNWYGEYVAAFHSETTDFRVSPVFHVATTASVEFAAKQGATEAALRRRFKWVQMASRHLEALRLDGGGAPWSS
jgi:hypothetical protein